MTKEELRKYRCPECGSSISSIFEEAEAEQHLVGKIIYTRPGPFIHCSCVCTKGHHFSFSRKYKYYTPISREELNKAGLKDKYKGKLN